MTNEEPVRLVVLGREIGIYLGWDILENNSFVAYGFQPIAGLNLPSGDLVIDYDRGVAYLNEKAEDELDLVALLYTLPVVT